MANNEISEDNKTRFREVISVLNNFKTDADSFESLVRIIFYVEESTIKQSKSEIPLNDNYLNGIHKGNKEHQMLIYVGDKGKCRSKIEYKEFKIQKLEDEEKYNIFLNLDYDIRGLVKNIGYIPEPFQVKGTVELNLRNYNPYNAFKDSTLEAVLNDKKGLEKVLDNFFESIETTKGASKGRYESLRVGEPTYKPYLLGITTSDLIFEGLSNELEDKFKDNKNTNEISNNNSEEYSIDRLNNFLGNQRQFIVTKIKEGDTRLNKVNKKVNNKVSQLKESGVKVTSSQIGKDNTNNEINHSIIKVSENKNISVLPHRVDIVWYNEDKTLAKRIPIYNIINNTFKENEDRVKSYKVNLGKTYEVVKELLLSTRLRK